MFLFEWRRRGDTATVTGQETSGPTSDRCVIRSQLKRGARLIMGVRKSHLKEHPCEAVLTAGAHQLK